MSNRIDLSGVNLFCCIFSGIIALLCFITNNPAALFNFAAALLNLVIYLHLKARNNA